jgi:hypothetical protein
MFTCTPASWASVAPGLIIMVPKQLSTALRSVKCSREGSSSTAATVLHAAISICVCVCVCVCVWHTHRLLPCSSDGTPRCYTHTHARTLTHTHTLQCMCIYISTHTLTHSHTLTCAFISAHVSLDDNRPHFFIDTCLSR